MSLASGLPDRRSQRIWEARLGPTHQNVALGLYNLGVLYTVTDQFPKAEEAYRQSIAIRESRFGKDHLLTGMSLHGMALTEAAQQKWTDAGQLMDRARRSVRRHVAVTLPV